MISTRSSLAIAAGAQAIVVVFLLVAFRDAAAPQSSSLPPRWRVESVRPTAAHPALRDLALPQVRWTGEDSSGLPGGPRFVIAIASSGGVVMGDVVPVVRSLDTREGLAELRAWWAGHQDARGRLWSDPSTVVQVYVDRAAPWSRLQSTLTFLMAPPHAVRDVWIAVHRDREVGAAYLRGRLGASPQDRTIRIRIRTEDERLDGLPEPIRAPPVFVDDARPYSRSDRSTYAHAALHVDGSGFDVRGEVAAVFAPIFPFDDPTVMAEANRAWTRIERQHAIARQTGDVHLSVYGDVAGREDGLASASVPAAYPLALIDLFHVRGQDVIADLLRDDLVLHLPVPESLRPPPPSSALPALVLVAAGVLAVLACLAVAWPHR